MLPAALVVGLPTAHPGVEFDGPPLLVLEQPPVMAALTTAFAKHVLFWVLDQSTVVTCPLWLVVTVRSYRSACVPLPAPAPLLQPPVVSRSA